MDKRKRSAFPKARKLCQRKWLPERPDLVADTSGEESHELWGLVALRLPVLDGVSAQEVVKLDGQHGARHLLVVRRLLA